MKGIRVQQAQQLGFAAEKKWKAESELNPAAMGINKQTNKQKGATKKEKKTFQFHGLVAWETRSESRRWLWDCVVLFFRGFFSAIYRVSAGS